MGNLHFTFELISSLFMYDTSEEPWTENSSTSLYDHPTPLGGHQVSHPP